MRKYKYFVGGLIAITLSFFMFGRVGVSANETETEIAVISQEESAAATQAATQAQAQTEEPKSKPEEKTEQKTAEEELAAAEAELAAAELALSEIPYIPQSAAQAGQTAHVEALTAAEARVAIAKEAVKAAKAKVASEKEEEIGDIDDVLGISSCKKAVGMGFLSKGICAMMSAFHSLIDWLMSLIGNSLEWRINDLLIDIWASFLPLANIAFAIVFLIIIYSTATGVGLTNYSIKKIMPRLIIIVIAVNISYYICVALADLSNIVGANLEGLFNLKEARDSYMASSNAGDLIGAAAGVGAVIFFIWFSWAMVLVALIGILAALAARYIVLFLLVAISPLAIVCALLPQTEKWFRKWLNTYVQMLVAYPVFMLAWYGVRWIEYNRILSADGNVIGMIIALLLPIAPLFVVKPALKMGGGMMAKLSNGIEKGLQGSPLGTAAKNIEKTRQNNFKAKLPDIHPKDLKKPTVEAADEERDKRLLALAKAKGLKDGENDFTDAGQAKAALQKQAQDLEKDGDSDGSVDINNRLNDINDVHKQLGGDLDEDENRENMEYNEKNSKKIDRRRMLNKGLLRGSRFVTGESRAAKMQDAEQLLEANRKRRNAEDGQNRLDKERPEYDENGNLIPPKPKNPILNSASRPGVLELEKAKLDADIADKTLQNAVTEQKLGASVNDGRTGVLFGAQSSLNQANRNDETLAEALKADEGIQKNADIINTEKARAIGKVGEVAENSHKTLVEEMNTNAVDEATIKLKEKREKMLNIQQEAKEAKTAQVNIKKAEDKVTDMDKLVKESEKELNEFEKKNKEMIEIADGDGGTDETVEAKIKYDDLVKKVKINQESLKKATSNRDTVVEKNRDLASSTVAKEAEFKAAQLDYQTNERAELNNNVTFRAMNSAKVAENAKVSYEAAVNRASRGLTSEVNAQKVNQIKDQSVADLDLDKSTRLAQDKEMQKINFKTRATKERAVNIDRVVNVDYANVIKADVTTSIGGMDLATYAGGGGLRDTEGSLRKSNNLARTRAEGAANKISDADWVETQSIMKSYLDNNPTEARWDEFYDKNTKRPLGILETAVNNGDTATISAIVEYQKSKGQVQKANLALDTLAKSDAGKHDPIARQFIANESIKMGKSDYSADSFGKYRGKMDEIGRGDIALCKEEWAQVEPDGSVPARVALDASGKLIEGKGIIEVKDESGKVMSYKLEYNPTFTVSQGVDSGKMADWDKDSWEWLAETSPENTERIREKYGFINYSGKASKNKTDLAMEVDFKGNKAKAQENLNTIAKKIDTESINPSSWAYVKSVFLDGKPTKSNGQRVNDKRLELDEDSQKVLLEAFESFQANPELKKRLPPSELELMSEYMKKIKEKTLYSPEI